MRRRATGAALVVLGCAVAVLLTTCSQRVSLYEQAMAAGVLRVATVNRAITYYESASGDKDGFDYRLATDFADSLGLSVQWLVLPSTPLALDAVADGSADFAAAGIAISPERDRAFAFTAPLREFTPQIIYRRGTRRPRGLDDIDTPIPVPADTAVMHRLAAQLATLDDAPGLRAMAEADDETLSYQVAQGEIDLAAVRSDIVAINRRYYPKLAVAFNLGEPLPVAWAFAPGDDASLYNRAIGFIERQRKSTELARVRDRYFGQLGRLGYVGSRQFSRDVERKLPRYRPMFEAAAEAQGLDWRLLAAVGYQESHWDPDARSPTGVRGLMMLTRDTARYLNIANRRDARQSIDGGARYLREQIDRLPDEIPEPDRTWMALAAYNLGLGHLLDARKLTEQLGGDPNRWVDVRKNLPLLTQSQWHSKTRHGYARGHEAVTYVGNIRTYFDILAWVTEGETDPVPRIADAPPEPETGKDPQEDNPLDIDSPIF